MTELFEKVKTFVDESFKGRGQKHFERTVYWITVLKPDADEALRIAGYAHDIQRALAPQDLGKQFAKGEALEYHQKEWGRIMYDFLQKAGAKEELCKRVQLLIEKHEVGGNEDQNVLKDADSISLFETNVGKAIKFLEKGFSKEEVKWKFNWMFTRITSEKAKEIAKPMYEKALKMLEEA